MNRHAPCSGHCIEHQGVTIDGPLGLASRGATQASEMYARNLLNFLAAFWNKDAGRPVLDAEIGDAIRRADKALYAAKEAGRNQIRGDAELLLGRGSSPSS